MRRVRGVRRSSIGSRQGTMSSVGLWIDRSEKACRYRVERGWSGRSLVFREWTRSFGASRWPRSKPFFSLAFRVRMLDNNVGMAMNSVDSGRRCRGCRLVRWSTWRRVQPTQRACRRPFGVGSRVKGVADDVIYQGPSLWPTEIWYEAMS